MKAIKLIIMFIVVLGGVLGGIFLVTSGGGKTFLTPLLTQTCSLTQLPQKIQQTVVPRFLVPKMRIKLTLTGKQSRRKKQKWKQQAEMPRFLVPKMRIKVALPEKERRIH